MENWWEQDAAAQPAASSTDNWWETDTVADAPQAASEPFASSEGRGPLATILGAVPVIGEASARFSDSSKQSGASPTRNAATGGVASFLKGSMRDIPQAAGAVQSMVTGQDPRDTFAYKAGTGLGALIDQDFPIDPSRQGTLLQQVGEGIGQMGSFALTGGGKKAVLMGMTQTGAGGLREAIERDATPGQMKMTFALNAALGITEALPLNRLIERLNKASGGKAEAIIREAIQTGTEEAIQEALQTLGSNIIAKDIVGFDPDRARLDGVGEASLVGGIVGGTMGGAGATGRVAGDYVTPEELRRDADGAQAALESAAERARANQGQVDPNLPPSSPEPDASSPEPTPPPTPAPISPTGATIEPDSEPVQEIPARFGQEAVAYDPQGGKTPVRYAVVEAGDLIASHDDGFNPDPRYPAILQPRDRNRKAAQAQVVDMASNLNPEQLGEGSDAGTGSPIISINGVVESGNGRTMAIRRAYGQGLDSANAYRDHLAKLGYDVEGMAAPVLVRIADPERSDAERIDFTRRANASPVAKTNATEQAVIDAQRLVPEDFTGISADGPPLNDPGFVQHLLGRLTTQADRGNLISGNGVLSKEGRRRLEGAMVAYAYGSPKLVEGMIETDDADLRGIGRALTDAAPFWAALQAEIGAGTVDPRVDINGAINRALEIIVDARRQGRKVSEQLDLAETDMFGDAPSTDVRTLVSLFVDPDTNRQRAQKKIVDALRYYAQEARKTQPNDGSALFPDDGEPATRIIDRILNPNEEMDLFDVAPPTSSDAFKRWFGDSKMVDEDGNPAVFYHGTGATDLSDFAFDPARIGQQGTAEGRGFYFTDNRNVAEGYGSDGSIVEAYLKVEKPMAIDHPAFNQETLADIILKVTELEAEDNGDPLAYGFLSAYGWMGDDATLEDMRGLAIEAAKSMAGEDVAIEQFSGIAGAGVDPIIVNRAVTEITGFDAIISDGFDNLGGSVGQAGGGRIVVVFNPSQIKSVNNRGTFDPNDDRVLYDRGDGETITEPATEPLPVDGRGNRIRVPRQTPPGQTPGVQKETKGLHEITRNIVEAVGGPVRQGRMGQVPQSVRGFYKIKTDALRMRQSYLSQITTTVHELGHRIDFRNFPAVRDMFRRFPQQIEQAAYEGAPEPVRINEGFAELVRLYVTNPAYGARNYPEAFAALDMALEADMPELREELLKARDAYQQLLTAPSAENVAGSVVTESGRGAIKRFGDTVKSRGGWIGAMNDFVAGFYTRFIDSDHPLAQLRNALVKVPVENGRERRDLETADDPYKLARLTKDAHNRGLLDIQFGVHRYHEWKGTGPSLSDALELAFGKKGDGWNRPAYNNFGAYLIARRAVKEWARYREGLIKNPPVQQSEADLRAAIADFERANPTWKAAAEMVHEFSGEMLRKRRDAGLISNATYEAIAEVDRDYVPFYRDMSDKAKGGKKKGQPVDNDGAGRMARFDGSNRPVLNPIESLIKDTYVLNSLIAKNDVLKALKRLADTAGRGSAEFVEVVPAHEIKVTNVDIIDALTRRLKSQMGGPLAKSFGDEVLELLEGDPMGKNFSMTETTSRGEPILYVYENGKRIPLRLGDGALGAAAFDAFTGLNKEVSNALVNILALPSSGLRAGITTSPDFIFANFVRDSVSSWILNEGVIPVVDQVVGMVDDLTGAEAGRLYALGGGLMGGLQTTALNDGKIQKEIAQARKDGMKIRRFRSWRGFNRMTEVSETGTRIALFKRYYESARRRGLSNYDAMLDAAYEARDYIDFGRRGSLMVGASRLVPFLNASLQGLDKARRVAGGEGAVKRSLKPYLERLLRGEASDADLTPSERRNLRRGQKMWMKVASLAMPSLALFLMYIDDEEYRDFPIYLRSTHWMIRMGPVGSEWLAIPKPFELAIVANAMEAAFNKLQYDDPRAADDFKASLLHTIVPPHSIPGVVVPLELMTNYSLFHDRNIVPYHMTGLPKDEQYTEYTSSLGKLIGKAIGQSPAKVDHALGGFGGSWSRNAQSVSDQMDPSKPDLGPADWAVVRRFIKDPVRGARSSASIYDRVARNGEWSAKANGLRRMMDQQRNKEARDYLMSMTRDEQYWALLYGQPADEVKATLGVRDAVTAKRMHPMTRAYDGMSSISGLARELATNRVQIAENERFSRFPSKLRKEYVDRLADLRIAYARNGLILTEQDGFADRELTPEAPIIADLMRISPELTAELDRRMGKDKVTPEDEVAIRWQVLKDRLDATLPQPPE